MLRLDPVKIAPCQGPANGQQTRCGSCLVGSLKLMKARNTRHSRGETVRKSFCKIPIIAARVEGVSKCWEEVLEVVERCFTMNACVGDDCL